MNKVISGLETEIDRFKFSHFSEKDKLTIIEDYLQSGLSKAAIWKKYTGRIGDHGLIGRWMAQYGYISKPGNYEKGVIFASQTKSMKKQDSVSDFEYRRLQKRILELENKLQEAEMKSIAWQTMVEIAEREFNISIKKKFNTKPSKR